MRMQPTLKIIIESLHRKTDIGGFGEETNRLETTLAPDATGFPTTEWST